MRTRMLGPQSFQVKFSLHAARRWEVCGFSGRKFSTGKCSGRVVARRKNFRWYCWAVHAARLAAKMLAKMRTASGCRPLVSVAPVRITARERRKMTEVFIGVLWLEPPLHPDAVNVPGIRETIFHTADLMPGCDRNVT